MRGWTPLLVLAVGCAKIVGIEDYQRRDAGGDSSPMPDAAVDGPSVDARPFGILRTYIKATNTTLGDQFGYRLALSADGNTLAVGAYLEDSAATGVGGNQADETSPSSGAVYVYVRAGGTWMPQAYVKASTADLVGADQFGISVALSADGNTMAVGAFGEDSVATGVGGNEADNTAASAGAVYVFTRSGTTWTQQAYVKASNTGAADQFGQNVALSADGNTLAVGAYLEDSISTGVNQLQADETAPSAGAVYVFTRAGTAWSQEAYVKASNTASADQFGFSVALSADGNTLAVGANGEDSNANGVGGNEADNTASSAGAVYVFTRAATTWSQQAYVKASNSDTSDLFGHYVALSADGNTLAVGAYGEDAVTTGVNGQQADETASSAGAVYVFVRVGTAWAQEAYVKASNTQAVDQFGYSVALSPDGNLLAVGAVTEDSNADGVGGNQMDETAPSSGAAYVLVRSGTTWSHRDYVKATNSDASDQFGFCVAAAAGGLLAVGANNERSASTGVGGDQADNAASSAGAVYVYE